jgi:hypothetical protein
MRKLSRVKVSLRVTHPTAKAEAIERELDIAVCVRRSVGEPRETPAGTPLAGKNETSFVSVRLEDGAEDGLGMALARVVSFLEFRRDGINALVSTGGTAEIYVGWFLESDDGVTISRDMLARIAATGVSLSLEVYH